jgi:hypothetical protein
MVLPLLDPVLKRFMRVCLFLEPCCFFRLVCVGRLDGFVLGWIWIVVLMGLFLRILWCGLDEVL